jgi:hypothetical protein
MFWGEGPTSIERVYVEILGQSLCRFLAKGVDVMHMHFFEMRLLQI